jgi:hypothetical protein
MQRKKTTSEILPTVGLEHRALLNYIARHPDLKPAERLPNGDYLWSDEEIARLLEARQQKKRRIKK